MESPVSGEYLLNSMGIIYSRKGPELVANCPFHEEKTPSFFMNNETTAFHCFGCGKSGNWYSFIKDLTNQNPFQFLNISNNNDWKVDPIDMAFNKALQKINEPTPKNKEIKKKMVLSIIAEKLPPLENRDCQLYCLQRNITSYDISKYGIFYIEDGYIGATRYTKRLVIPVCNEEGEIIAYEGRDVTRSADKKCLYPYTSQIGSTLFDIQTLDFDTPIIFVEGIMDVFLVKKFTELQVTTAFGIQLTNKQKEIIKRFKNMIILYFDPDDGGRRGIANFEDCFEDKDNIFIANNFKHKNDPGESTQEEVEKALLNKISLQEFYLNESELLQPNIVEW